MSNTVFWEMDDVHPVISELRVQVPLGDNNVAAAYRMDALHMLHPVALYYGLATRGGGATQAVTAQALRRALPANVHLHTLRAMGADLDELHQRCDPFASLKGCADKIALTRQATAEQRLELIVRFQHLYAADEHTEMSQPATVNMTSFFASVLPGLEIAGAIETTLVAADVLGRLPYAEQAAIRLAPLQIRTFVVTMTSRRRGQ